MLALLLYHFFLQCLAHDFNPANFDGHVNLYPGYDLYWSNVPGAVRLGFEVSTEGWFGFGLSPNGGMFGADIMLARNVGSQVVVTDHFATQQSVPPEDIRSFVDWQLMYANLQAGVFRVIVQRDLNTKDSEDIPLVAGSFKHFSVSPSLPLLSFRIS